MNGGFAIKPVKDSDFKYTKNKSRKEWVKQIYPFGEHIIPLFLNIPWEKYYYKGDYRAWYMNEDDEIKYKDLKIKKLGCWISKQIQTYKNKIISNVIIYDTWSDFINDDNYKEHFLDNNIVWLNTLEEVKKYIDENKKKMLKKTY